MNKIVYIILVLCCFKAEAQNTSALAIGDRLFNLGDYSKAISFYNQLPQSEAVHFKLAKSYEALGNNPIALQYYKELISENPKAVLATYNYGKLLFKTSKYRKANSIFKKLSEENPNNPNFVYQQGLVKEKLNDSTAISYFQKTIAIDSNHINALYKIAKLHLEKRRFKQAEVFINKGILTDTLSIRFLTLKALKQYHEKEYHKVIETYKKLLLLGKKEERIHVHLANSYRKVLNYEEAIKQYTLLINRYDDKNPIYHYNLGLSFLVLHYLDKAKKHFEISIALKYTPLDTEYVTLGMLYKREKKYKKALILFKKALRDHAKNEMASYQIAVVSDTYFEDKKQALRYYEKYLKIHGKTGRMRELAKARVSDLKAELHFKD